MRAALGAMVVLTACGSGAAPRAAPVAHAPDVVAIVNGEEIHASEIEGVAPELRGVMLDHVIDERLAEQAARAAGVVVTDADVDAAIANVPPLGGRPPTDADAAHRADIARQLRWFRLLRARVGPTITIDEAAVRAHYDALVAAAHREGSTEHDGAEYEAVRDTLAAQMRQEAMLAQEPVLRETLRREASIERFVDAD
jgi:hypothetical protein